MMFVKFMHIVVVAVAHLFSLLHGMPLQMLMKKLINSQSKKEIENFIQDNLRIITQETVFQKPLRTVLPIKDQSTVIYIFETKVYTPNDILTVYAIQICSIK